MSATLVPNLGAEEGDEEPRRPVPSRAAAVRLWRLLFAADARVLGEEPPVPAWPEALGRPAPGPAFPWLEPGDDATAWLNTEAAAARSAAAGIRLSGAPPEVVRRVHDKAFAHAAAEAAGLVPGPLRGAIAVLDAADLQGCEAVPRVRACAASLPAWAQSRCVLKPRLGSSGRGRVASRDGVFDGTELSGALPRLAARGGALLEPWLERTSDLSAQLFLPEDGEDGVDAPRLVATTTQLVSPSGVYRGSRGEFDARGRFTSGSPHDEDLRVAAAAVARAARAVGYRGPCGVDAFAFRHEGREVFRPVVELNARFTMGIVAVGLVRRLLPALKERLGMQASERRAFHFGLDAPDGGWPEAAPGQLFVPLWRDGDAVRPGLFFAGDVPALVERGLG